MRKELYINKRFVGYRLPVLKSIEVFKSTKQEEIDAIKKRFPNYSIYTFIGA